MIKNKGSSQVTGKAFLMCTDTVSIQCML